MKAGEAKTAHAVLLDLFNNVAPTPEQIRFTALAASSAGDTGDAAYYMSEYHIATGNLPLSVAQLEMALAAPNITARPAQPLPGAPRRSARSACSPIASGARTRSSRSSRQGADAEQLRQLQDLTAVHRFRDEISCSNLCCSAAVLAGCATLPSGKPDPRDPWERFNRSVVHVQRRARSCHRQARGQGLREGDAALVRTGVSNCRSTISTP